MLTALLSILTSSGLGGILGVVGSWLTKREERENLKLKFQHDVKMAEIREREAKLEFDHELALADKEIERAETEGQIQQDILSAEAFKTSLQEQAKTYGIKFVDAIRGLMRPLITVYLLAIGTYLTVKIGMLVGGVEEAFQPEELITMYRDVIAQIMFLVTTAVTWWFGSRPAGARSK